MLDFYQSPILADDHEKYEPPFGCGLSPPRGLVPVERRSQPEAPSSKRRHHAACLRGAMIITRKRRKSTHGHHAACPRGVVIPFITALRRQAPQWRRDCRDSSCLVMISARWGRAPSWRCFPLVHAIWGEPRRGRVIRFDQSGFDHCSMGASPIVAFSFHAGKVHGSVNGSRRYHAP